MIIKNSIRQLQRTPLKTALFLLLLISASALFSLGGYLWLLNSRNIERYEDAFTTIGTVEQRATTVKEEKIWDADIKEYHIYSSPEYNKMIPLSVLDFDGAEYIAGPERRCYYGSYCPEYDNASDGFMDGVIVEATPLKDCIPDGPVKLRIKKVLYGVRALEGVDIWFINLFDPNPRMLLEGKTYVMSLNEYYKVTEKNILNEYVPSYDIKTTQVTSEGESVEDGISEDYFYEEVTDGFYDTEMGKHWQEFAKAKAMWLQTIPVTPTENTYLLMPFYNGDAYICQGQDITKDEYRNGSKVCLISDNFARRNQLEIGDSMHLSLYYASYERSPGSDFALNGSKGRAYSMLNANGEVYPAFEDSNYVVTGIYDISSGATTGMYGVGINEVIIPQTSVKNSDKDNIAAYEPMMGYNTSFQIPNGQIEQYLSAWEKVGTKELELTFYDKGYSQLSAGMKNMKNMSRIFFIAGLILVLLVLIFFNNLFISSQRKRTAIERSMGFSKKQCIGSMLSGIFILIVIGSVIGCTVGTILTNKISTEAEYKSYYDITYGNTAVYSEADDIGDVENDFKSMIKVSFGMIGLISLFGISISFILISNNLKKEPLELLASACKE